jgi:ATP-dependent DNA ligase
MPTQAYKVLAGPDWVHEIKHDGYRLIVRRDADRSFASRTKASSTRPQLAYQPCRARRRPH